MIWETDLISFQIVYLYVFSYFDGTEACKEYQFFVGQGETVADLSQAKVDFLFLISHFLCTGN